MLRIATSQVSLHKPLWARGKDSKKGERQRSPCVHIPGSKEPCEAPSLETRLFPILSRETGSSRLSSEERDCLSCLLRNQDTIVEGFLGIAVLIPKPLPQLPQTWTLPPLSLSTAEARTTDVANSTRGRMELPGHLQQIHIWL